MNEEMKKKIIKELKKAKYAVVMTDKSVAICGTGLNTINALANLASSMYSDGLSIELIREVFDTSLDAFEESLKKANKKKSMFSEREEENEGHLTILEDFAEFLKKLLGED